MQSSREITIVYHNPKTGVPLVNVGCSGFIDLTARIQRACEATKNRKPKPALLVVWIDGEPDHSYTVE